MATKVEGDQNDEDATYYKQVMSMMETEVSDKSFDNFHGAEQSVQMLKENIVLPLRYPQLFQESRRIFGDHLMLYGAPGCGKSHLLNACAQGADVKLFIFNVWNLQCRTISGEGRTGKCIETVFKIARNNAPCILCFEDMEQFGGKDFPNEAKITLLQKLTEPHCQPKENAPVYRVIGMTQRPWEVDYAVRRYFLRKTGSHVPMPDQLARLQLLKALTKDMSHDLQMKDFEDIAEKTQGFTGADIHCLVRSASMAMIKDIMKATHFKLVQSEGAEQNPSAGQDHQSENQSQTVTSNQGKQTEDVKAQGKFKPCKPEDKDAIRMSFIDIAEDRLFVEHEITARTFKQALTETCSTVTNEDIAKLQRFEDDFG